jgi:lipoprotein NlpD
MAVALLLPACASTSYYGAPTLYESQRNLYTIREGESLYGIAWRYDLNYKDVASWNNIQAPYTIYPGQRISLNPPPTVARAETLESQSPLFPLAAPTPPASRAQTSPLPSTQDVHATPVTSRPDFSPSTPAPTPLETTISSWQWPLQGQIIDAFSPAGSKKGIDIAGNPGEPILAASSGKVVYSGGGLVGYGQLIIIKHDQNFLSAYGHNRKLLVKEGEQVRVGQSIAELGSTGTNRAMLHFEIRRDGTPVDPLQYLPPR